MALYLGLSGPEARRAALTAAAQTALRDKPGELAAFQLVARAMKPIRSRRNELAHGLWGVSDELPDALLWSAQQDDMLLQVRLKDSVEPEQTGNSFREAMYEGVQVYRHADLESDLADARDAYNAAYYLSLYLAGDSRIESNIKALRLMKRYEQAT